MDKVFLEYCSFDVIIGIDEEEVENMINKPKPAEERNSVYFDVEIKRSRLK